MGCYLQSETTVAPRNRAAMPASVNESVTASLLLSLSTKSGHENGEVSLDQRMAAASKRVLLTDIEYEVSNDTYHNSVLQGLKAKYSDQNDKSRLTNGSSPSLQVSSKSKLESSSPCLPTPARVLYPMEKVQMQWPSNCSIGNGFINAGNSCYLNSVLQALFHIPPLFNWLTEGDKTHQENCPTYKNNGVECIICCMAVTLRNSQKSTNNYTRPYLILQRLRSICRRLIPGQQEDAMEFLRYLFEAMEKNYVQRYSNLKLDNFSKETSPLNQIFGGYIRTDVTCLYCHGVSTTFQHFMDLTLDISRGSSLENALDTYFCQEKLEGDNSYRCDKCRRKVPAAKQFFIERLPNVLCIQLKRFNIEGKKISKCVQLADRINLQRFLSRPRLPAGSPFPPPRPRGACYRLAAGVNHLGHTAQSGHYTTSAYAANGQLYHFDDSSVSKMWRGINGSDVYLLMYILESAKQEQSKLGPLPVPSATTTSQQVTSSPRVQAKTVVPSPFIPAQCRLKPSIILNQNRKLLFGPAAIPTPSPTTKEQSPSASKLPESPVSKPRSPLVTAATPKPSKLVLASPTANQSQIAISPIKPTVSNGPSTSSALSPTKERIVMKIRNGQVQPSMPSLVPYSEEHSSGDEDGASSEASATPSTNGWTVTPTENGHGPKDKGDLSKSSVKIENKNTKPHTEVVTNQLETVKKISKLVLPESSKTSSSKVNGLDIQKKSSYELPKKSMKMDVPPDIKLFNGLGNGEFSSQSSASSSCVSSSPCTKQNECMVRSTSSSWQVSTAESSVSGVAAATSWVVTSAPTSEPTSSEPSPGPQTSPSPPHSQQPRPQTLQAQQQPRKRKASNSKSSSSSSSSSSDSDSSSDSESKQDKKGSRKRAKNYVWVERTKETIFSNGKPQKPLVSNSANKPTSTETLAPVSEALRKMSHAGYGAQVTTWNGGRSLVERQVQDERREQRRQYDQDCDYDSEMDAGRRKKVKTRYDEDESFSFRGNRFQQEADYRRTNNYNYYPSNGGGDGYDRRTNHWSYPRGNSSGDRYYQQRHSRPPHSGHRNHYSDNRRHYHSGRQRHDSRHSGQHGGRHYYSNHR